MLMKGSSVERSSKEVFARQDFQGLRHDPEEFKQRGLSRARGRETGRSGVSDGGCCRLTVNSHSTGEPGLSAEVLHAYAAAQCKEMEEVLFRLQGLESATKSQRMSRGAARGLTYQTEMLRGRLALRALLQEAELCVLLRQNAQQFKERLQALVPRGREGGRGLGSGTDGLVLVDAAALRDARDAAASVQQAVRDAIAVAVRQAEERVHSSWERAWDEQGRQLRRARARVRPLAERMRSARGLGRRAQALGSRCYAACKPLLEARSRGEAPTWGLVMPLVDAADGLMREADALSARTSEVCAAIGRPVEEAVVAPSEERVESSPEWQEWEVEASLRRVDAPGEEWAWRWRARVDSDRAQVARGLWAVRLAAMIVSRPERL